MWTISRWSVRSARLGKVSRVDLVQVRWCFRVFFLDDFWDEFVGGWRNWVPIYSRECHGFARHIFVKVWIVYRSPLRICLLLLCGSLRFFFQKCATVTYVTSLIPMSHLHSLCHTAQIYEMASDLCELQASHPDLLPQYIEGVGAWGEETAL